MTNLICGIKCNNVQASFIHRCLFNNLVKTGETYQEASYVQHLKEVSDEFTNEAAQLTNSNS